MKTYFLSAIKITFLTLILFGVMYPLLITGISKVVGPNHGEGETLNVNGKVIGFTVIGQSFDSAIYFQGRPSAVGYNAAATGGSNKGPGNPEYLASVQERIQKFLIENPEVKKENIPVDLVTASGGGLDPDITPEAARIQIPRIAKARGLSQDQLAHLVDQCTEKPWIGLLGPSHVNVLKLNVTLDKLKSKP